MEASPKEAPQTNEGQARPDPEPAPKQGPTRYRVLRQTKTEAGIFWEECGVATARGARQAKAEILEELRKKATGEKRIEGDVTLVAVPDRSWQPETARSKKVESVETEWA